MDRFVFVLLLSLPVLARGINILGLEPVPSPSHHNWNRHLFYKLAAQGYNLTVLSADVDKHTTPGLHYIWAEKVYSNLYNGSEAFKIQDLMSDSPFEATSTMYDIYEPCCKGFYISDGFKRLLDYPKDFKFDLVLIDITIEPCLLGFLDRFNYPPVVGMTAFSLPHQVFDYIGGHKLPSYVQHYEAKFESLTMNFCERLKNFAYYVYDDVYRRYVSYPIREKSMREGFGNPNLDINKLHSKVILVLVNTHFAIEKTEPLPPNIIPVGGLQIQEAKPLDKELELFASSAKKGVVLFSLGTNMKSDSMDEEKKLAFVEAFRQLPDYHFIWKYESDFGSKLPKNVKTVGWVSQNDILAHPKTRAFISHCGLLGTQEAAWHGIPIVGLPLFADQFKNLRVGLRDKTAVELSYDKLLAPTIKGALKEVLENPVYFKTAQTKARLIQDRPQKPIDTALFWVEWVLRHKDDHHAINLPISELGIIASNSYDVLAFLLGSVIFVFVVLLKILLKVCGSQKQPVVKQKRN